MRLSLNITNYSWPEDLGGYLRRVVRAADDGRAERQLGVVDGRGRAASHTGSECNDWAGHVEGEGFAVQGNILAGQAVVDEMARAYRRFAHTYPVTYGLAFSTMIPEARADPAELAQMVLPLQQIWGEVVGQERSLTALRGALAILHGYVTLEKHTRARAIAALLELRSAAH